MSKRQLMSSFHIDPIDINEYNGNVAAKLARYHKQKFLEFIRTERSFLHGNFKI